MLEITEANCSRIVDKLCEILILGEGNQHLVELAFCIFLNHEGTILTAAEAITVAKGRIALQTAASQAAGGIAATVNRASQPAAA